MILYLFIAASFFIVGLITVLIGRGQFLAWIPELIILSLFWPFVILCAVIKRFDDKSEEKYNKKCDGFLGDGIKEDDKK